MYRHPKLFSLALELYFQDCSARARSGARRLRRLAHGSLSESLAVAAPRGFSQHWRESRHPGHIWRATRPCFLAGLPHRHHTPNASRRARARLCERAWHIFVGASHPPLREYSLTWRASARKLVSTPAQCGERLAPHLVESRPTSFGILRSPPAGLGYGAAAPPTTVACPRARMRRPRCDVREGAKPQPRLTLPAHPPLPQPPARGRASGSRRRLPRGPEDSVVAFLEPLWSAGAADAEARRHGEASFVRAASALLKLKPRRLRRLARSRRFG